MSRSRALVAGIAAVVVAVLAAAAPASAHDQLVSSSPSAGERLASGPDEIALTFSADVQRIGAEVVVVDAAGTDWVGADPQITGPTVSVPLTGALPPAGYEVRWRVVSSDGHPISGLIPFTVGDAAPLQRSAAPAPSAPAAAEAPSGDAGVPRVVVVGAIGAGLALAVFAVLLLVRRARRGRHS